jgi:hypothetical protein
MLSAETGITPLDRASGKTHTVAFRHAADCHKRQVLQTCLDSRRSSDWARGATLLHAPGNNGTDTLCAV